MLFTLNQGAEETVTELYNDSYGWATRELFALNWWIHQALAVTRSRDSAPCVRVLSALAWRPVG